MSPRSWALILCVGISQAAYAAQIDTDGDGLSDFQERHKYFTDPRRADSDGDGKPDGAWSERSEFTYAIRSVIKVMRPCDSAAANDDYQDARVLSKTDGYVELEVVHYPLNTNAAAITASRSWRAIPPALRAFVRPGVTTNWDAAMRRDLEAALNADGIDVTRLTDKQLVEQVAGWLLARGKYRYMFGTYFMDFSDGTVRILPGLEAAFRREGGNTDLPFEQHLQHEVFGKGMYKNRSYGTCTSAATYLTTGLRALGIPSRMVLAIPLVDGSDPQQVRLVEEHVTHHQVRRTLLAGLPPSGFAAHTFNEVYVGGRWRRLNYGTLGQNTYGPGAMGMLTHVLTFLDLSEAGLTSTWGWRYGRRERDAVFRGSNPYRATEISDRFGVHSELENPPVPQRPKVATISRAYWFFSDQRPPSVPADSVRPSTDGHLLVHVDLSFDELKPLYPKLDKGLLLLADGHPTVSARAERGFWNSECYVRIAADDFARMAAGVTYRLSAAEPEASYRLAVRDGGAIIKPE